MAKRKPRSQRKQPLVPFSGDYIWVETKENSFWRRKRGTLKPAKLNEAFKKNVSLAKLSGPAAKRMVAKLHPFIYHLYTGRITLRFSNLIIKTLKEKDKIDFSLFKGYEIQEDFPMSLLCCNYQVKESSDEVLVKVPINRSTIPYKSSLVTHYYFELILLHGDPTKEKSLRTESVVSSLYPFTEWIEKSVCSLSIELPANKKPWMVLLKVNCLEGNELAVHPRHYAMTVVAVGSSKQ